MSCPLAHESVWIEKAKYSEVEKNYYEKMSKLLTINPMESTAATSSAPTQVNGGNSAGNPPSKSKKNRNNKKKEPAAPSSGSVVLAGPAPAVLRNHTAVVAQEPPPQQQQQPQQQQPPVTPKEGSVDTTNEEVKNKKKKKKKNNNKQGSNASPTPSGDNNKPSGLTSAPQHQHQKSQKNKMDGIASLAGASAGSCELLERIVALEKQNSDLSKLVEKLSKTVLESQNKIKALEDKVSGKPVAAAAPAKPAAAPAKPAPADDDDGVDLFASDDEEDADAAKIREERLAAYAAKKSKKPALIAKSSVLLDVKPWDDETDMKEMEKNVRTIEMDGLLWGASKLVPVGYGINKLQIMCVIEDDKVSVDLLSEQIEAFEDFVQSVDIAAFQKI